MTPPLKVQPGVNVTLHGRRYRIQRVVDFDTVLAVDSVDKTSRELAIRDLQPAPDESVSDHPTRSDELTTVPEADWHVAQRRFEIIKPLLQTTPRTARDVQQRALEAGIHWVTLYRWLDRYLATEQVSALLPIERPGGRGQSRLSAAVEALLQATINEHYLSVQKPRIKATYDELRRRCHLQGVTAPSLNTVRQRIAQLDTGHRLRRRGQRRQAEARYRPIEGTFPNADWPLAVVQIDHTPCDVIIVDDAERLPIGRPWITLAIDVYSRLVAGFYIALDPPSALSTGLCLSHAMLPKDDWLAKRGITTAWPVWGVMDVVHVDNAKEFRGAMLQRACEQYGIDVHWRPVARPHFGGHIERLCGTLNQALHTLPGSTFSNPNVRGDYPSEAKAALTLDELERWLALYITDVYHQRNHDGLGQPPLKQFEQGIFGDSRCPGRGLAPRPNDPEQLRLDFMPFIERTVQPYGLHINGIQYYHDVLKPWINAPDPNHRQRKRTFIIRQDPRDISVVYFFDPELRQYFEIPYRNTAHPVMSVWALREVRRTLREQGQRAVNEDVIFEAYHRLRTLEADALRQTKTLRRQRERERRHAARERPALVPAATTEYPANSADDIQPFDEIEELHD